MHLTFAAEMLVHCDGVITSRKTTVTMMTFLFQHYVFCGSYIYVRETYFLNAIELAWEKHHAWGVAINVPKARTGE